jgi:hypothetical protein
MAITNQDGLVAAMATGQHIAINKTTVRSGLLASAWYSMLDYAGNPGAGVMAGTNTANGVVPTDATPGCPPINSFGAGNTGYLATANFGSSAASRFRLCDMLFKAGAYAFNANVSLASQPSYSARIPGGDYKGTELWLEAVTAFGGGNLIITVTYTDQDGNAGHTTGAVALGTAPVVGRMMQIPLAAGDSGLQKIESVTLTGVTSGSLNLLVLRPLWSGRVSSNNFGAVYGPDQTDLPILFDTSALILQLSPDGTSSGVSEMRFGVVNG